MKSRGRFYSELLLQSYEQLHGKTAEEVLVERDRQQEIIEMFQLVKEILTEEQFDILWKSTVEGLTQDKIAAIYGVKQPTINERLTTIYKKVNNNPIFKYKKSVYYEGLIPKCSTLEVHSPQIKVAYPSEYHMCVNAGGYFRKSKGKKKYISQEECKVPEYLNQSYNGEKIWCTLCTNQFGENKCTRLEERVSKP